MKRLAPILAALALLAGCGGEEPAANTTPPPPPATLNALCNEFLPDVNATLPKAQDGDAAAHARLVETLRGALGDAAGLSGDRAWSFRDTVEVAIGSAADDTPELLFEFTMEAVDYCVQEAAETRG